MVSKTFTPLGIVVCGIITFVAVFPWVIGITVIIKWIW